jgi:hypothetical protein
LINLLHAQTEAFYHFLVTFVKLPALSLTFAQAQRMAKVIFGIGKGLKIKLFLFDSRLRHFSSTGHDN